VKLTFNRTLFERLIIMSVMLSVAGCAAFNGKRPVSERPAAPGEAGIAPPGGGVSAADKDIWPEPFPPVGRNSIRPGLTGAIRRKLGTLGMNGVQGLDGRTVSRALALLPHDRGGAGVISFEIETGPDKGIHQCEALGRGATSLTAKPGWVQGTINEEDGREVPIFYAPKEDNNGATVPGVYDLRNMRPSEYKIKFLDRDTSGEEELVKRLSGPDADSKPFFTGAWLHWYPRDPRYAAIAPVDMAWSVRGQRGSQGADAPVFERSDVDKDPDQISRNPKYYTGPYGRYGTAIHTDRWNDPETALDGKRAAKDEFRSFLYRDTSGCLKVRPDCLLLINAFIDEQAAKNRAVQLEVREIR
jgi:hypothetical protein